MHPAMSRNQFRSACLATILGMIAVGCIDPAQSSLAAKHAQDLAKRADAKHQATSSRLADLQRDFVEARFGMFIHFGILTFTGHWAEGHLDLDQFNPKHLQRRPQPQTASSFLNFPTLWRHVKTTEKSEGMAQGSPGWQHPYT